MAAEQDHPTNGLQTAYPLRDAFTPPNLLSKKSGLCRALLIGKCNSIPDPVDMSIPCHGCKIAKHDHQIFRENLGLSNGKPHESAENDRITSIVTDPDGITHMLVNQDGHVAYATYKEKSKNA